MSDDVFQLPSARVHAGVARTDITPPEGIYCRVWGAAKHETPTALHHALTATALALRADAGGPALVLLGLDLGWLEPTENRRFLEAVREGAQVGADHLMVNLCHSHAAPPLCFDVVDRPGGDRIMAYFQTVIDRSIEAIQAAKGALQPAWITADYGRCSLAANRNYVDTDFGETVCGFNPHEPADDTLAYARVASDDGTTMATLLNYGCHPTTLGPRNTTISSDYVAAARRIVEDVDGGPCLFIISPCGDTAPRNTYASEPDDADRNGRQLGYAAASAATSLLPPGEEMVYAGPLISGATLGTWTRRPIAPDGCATVRSARLDIDLPQRKKEGMAAHQARPRHWQERRR